jgi:FkbM family methyltransferase
MGAIHFSLDPNLVHALRGTLPLEAFVETGTFQGDTACAMAALFASVHTIELSEELYGRAAARLASLANVTAMHGNSPDSLKGLATKLAGKSVLYWLDAHWCGGATSGDSYECPLLAEIAAIRSLNDQSVVLIDDARFFVAPPPPPHAPDSWPLIADVISALSGLSVRHKVWIINDVIVFAPEASVPDIVKYGRTYGVDLQALQAAAARSALASAPPAAAAPVERHKQAPFAFNYGLSSEERSERLFVFHLARLGIRQVLDIGANTGQFAGKLRKYGYDGVIHSVEPQAAAYAALLANAANDLRWLPTPRQGVGDVEGAVALNVSENSYSSSILQVQESHLRAAPQARSVGQETIYVSKASNLFKEEVMRSIEAVKMDVQGYEKHVLDGLASHLDHVRLLMLEMSLVECYSGEADLFELDRFLTDRCGFSRISLEPSYYDDRAGVVQQYDGIYCRPEGDRSSGAAGGLRGVTIGAAITSIGGSERRPNDRGVDLGQQWHQACRQASRALTDTVVSVSESPPPDQQITWVKSLGKPAVAELLRAGIERTSGHLLVANSDILFNQAFRTMLSDLSSDALYYGRRHEVRENAEGAGPLRIGQPYGWGFDYFLMPGEFARTVVAEGLLPQEFLIGEPWWDYLIPVLGQALGFPVKRIGPQRVLALHYAHEQRFTQQTWLQNGNRFLACVRDLRARRMSFAPGLLAELLDAAGDPPDLQRVSNLICLQP